MNILMQVGVILYLFAIVPGIFGLAWNCTIKKENEYFWADGMFAMMALFALIAIPMVNRKSTPEELAKIWLVAVSVIVGIVLLLCNKRLWEQVKKEFGKVKQLTKTEKLLCGVMMLLVLGSILWVKPMAADETVSVVQTALDTNTMYEYHPYSGEVYAQGSENGKESPIEMLYAVVCSITGMNPAILIQFVVPFSLQICFFSVYREIGELLFGEERRKRNYFLFFVILLHLTPLYIDGQSLLGGVFRNAWNGETLLGCMVLPGVFRILLRLMKESKADVADKSEKVSSILKEICHIIVMLLVARLVYPRGGYYVILMLLLCGATIIVREGYRRYGITT